MFEFFLLLLAVVFFIVGNWFQDLIDHGRDPSQVNVMEAVGGNPRLVVGWFSSWVLAILCIVAFLVMLFF